MIVMIKTLHGIKGINVANLEKNHRKYLEQPMALTSLSTDLIVESPANI
jgi:hypothetical protein